MKKKKRPSRPDRELTMVWHEAWKEGIWLQIVGRTPGHCMAAAGSLQELKSLDPKFERWVLRMIRKNKLKLGDCVAFGAVPGVGKTPVEACRVAIKALKKELKLSPA